MIINVPNSCNNSPKKALLVQFNIAFAKADLEEILSFLDDDCEMQMVYGEEGKNLFKGKDAIREFLSPYAGSPMEEMHIHQVITHGKDAAVRGMMKSGGHLMNFADFIEFKSAGSDKIKKIVSYTK